MEHSNELCEKYVVLTLMRCILFPPNTICYWIKAPLPPASYFMFAEIHPYHTHAYAYATNGIYVLLLYTFSLKCPAFK